MRLLSLARLFGIATAAAALFFSPAGMTQGASKAKFSEINPAQPTEPGKIEVLEFFAYSCPHCAVLEPMTAKWTKTLPSDVVVRQVPVAFNAGMKPLQNLYYALEALNRLDLHPKVFAAIHQEKKRLFTKPEIVTWAVSQGLDKAKFESTFDSFGVQSKSTRAEQLTNAYRIQGTPSLAVGGKFITSPSEAGGYQETIDVAAGLVKQLGIKQ
ncbi:thiol:disulfide interchange protein DsbA/DsbL [Orrella sp. NBD-18]|uniref:Thiol:disulfide interchange protein n=1 Tax=Sheuella amnicola TaxID=2707330 RepID=A0A6B2QWN0_9BURK|nr:thiol:disulfide interchange protein DsbA/DsbL [Sheuella amnicola]NDY82412.1 thiol:disulfide interchange protein DsbA/DsbL [Sheuella amnicola]